MTRKKKKLLPNSLIVTQANELVEARYNLPLSEQRLMLMMIGRIQPDDEDFKPYQISVKEFAEFLGIPTNSAYLECKKITKSLLSRVLQIQEEDRLIQIGWMSSAEYVDGTGMVELSFDPKLKPYLLQLKSNFTSCGLGMLLSFKSQYSFRIYALLRQYLKLRCRRIELQTLREMLGLRSDLNTEYSDFKRNILLVIQNELKEKADLYFEFDEIKYGRKVGAILFHIFQKQTIKTLKENEKVSLFDNHVKISATSADLINLIPPQHQAKKTVLNAIIGAEKNMALIM